MMVYWPHSPKLTQAARERLEKLKKERVATPPPHTPVVRELFATPQASIQRSGTASSLNGPDKRVTGKSPELANAQDRV